MFKCLNCGDVLQDSNMSEIDCVCLECEEVILDQVALERDLMSDILNELR